MKKRRPTIRQNRFVRIWWLPNSTSVRHHLFEWKVEPRQAAAIQDGRRIKTRTINSTKKQACLSPISHRASWAVSSAKVSTWRKETMMAVCSGHACRGGAKSKWKCQGATSLHNSRGIRRSLWEVVEYFIWWYLVSLEQLLLLPFKRGMVTMDFLTYNF